MAGLSAVKLVTMSGPCPPFVSLARTLPAVGVSSFVVTVSVPGCGGPLAARAAPGTRSVLASTSPVAAASARRRSALVGGRMITLANPHGTGMG